jgi:lipopolysaccharide biosynthesis glycosyltransferase
METPSIVFSVNNDFISYLIVALRTLGRNNEYPIDIYIIHSDLSVENLNLLENICDSFNYKLNPIKIDANMFNGAREMGHLKIQAYYRIVISNLIKAKTILYLDCDIYVNSSIREIFNIDLEGYAVAAVKDPGFQPIEKLKMSPNATYFNSGVLLMNLDFWRENNLSRIVLEYAIDNTKLLSYADQCALNAVIDGKYISLDLLYNFQTIHLEMCPKLTINKAKIIHFTGSFKPTHFLNKHPFKEEYMKEFRNTPDYYRFKFKNFVRIFLKNIYLESLPSLARKYRLIK